MCVSISVEEVQVLKYSMKHTAFSGSIKALGITPLKACRIYNQALRKINNVVKKEGTFNMNNPKVTKEIARIIEIFKVDYSQ